MTSQRTVPAGARSASERAASAIADGAPGIPVAAAGELYDAGCRLWNAAIHARPGLVVRARDADDVAAAIAGARVAGLELSVKGGGYDWAGRALNDGGVVIDLGDLREVTIDGTVATVGGGATCSDLLDAAEAHGLSTVTGAVGGIGFAGQALTGGYGRLSGRLGLSADSLLGAEVVLADGSIVWTDERHEPGLFWALRGAGGNFGVVTSLRVALHPVTEVIGGLIGFPWHYAPRVLSAWLELVADAPDELTLRIGAISSRVEPMLFLNPMWCGTREEGERLLGRLRGLGDTIFDTGGPITVAHAIRNTNTYFPPGRRYQLGTRSLPELTAGAASAFLRSGAEIPAENCMIALFPMHGAATRVDVERTAIGWRTPHLVAEVVAGWTGGAGTAERAWGEETVSLLDDHAGPGGYSALLSPLEARRGTDAYGANARRLIALKDHFDPDGVFTANTMPDRALSGDEDPAA